MPPKFDPSEVKVGEYIYLLLYVYAIVVYSQIFTNNAHGSFHVMLVMDSQVGLGTRGRIRGRAYLKKQFSLFSEAKRDYRPTYYVIKYYYALTNSYTGQA